MARELRTLLLWGRRLRAPALATACGGEGDWTRAGGRWSLRVPTIPILCGTRGGCSLSRGAGGSVRIMLPARGER